MSAVTTVAEVTLGGVPYPLALGPGGVPSPIDVAPQVAFPDAIVLGETSERSDQRVASVIQSDFTGGIGTLEYTESQGVTTVRDSFADTRYAGVIASSLADSLAYGTIPGTPLAAGWHIEYLSNVDRVWAWKTNAFAYYYASPTWTATELFIKGVVRFKGLLVAGAERNPPAGPSTVGIFTSPDAITWTIAPTVLSGYCALTVHDNKVWIMPFDSTVLYSTTDPAGAATWTTAATLYMQLGESIVQLFDWRDRFGKRALYVLTTQRIIGYDDDDKEFSTFYDFSDQIRASTTVIPSAYVWRNNDDLYVTFYDSAREHFADTVIHFNGSIIETLGPNKAGGIVPGNQFKIMFLTGSMDYLYAIAASKSTATPGRILAMNSQQGWHTLKAGTTANPIVGGGYADGKLYIVRQSGAVSAIPDVDLGGNVLTLQADATRTYDTAAQTVESADLDGGTPGITKRLLWARVVCLQPDTALGSVMSLPAGATVQVAYRIDNGSWIPLTNVKVGGVVTPRYGGLDSTTIFPAILPVASDLGVSCQRWAWRLTLSRGTSNTIPTIVASVSWHYIRQPSVRYSYRARVDLRDDLWGGEALPQFGGRTAAQLRTALLAWPGNGLTTFSYGSGAAAVSMAAVDVVVRPVESSLTGTGIYDVVMRDLSSPDSGT